MSVDCRPIHLAFNWPLQEVCRKNSAFSIYGKSEYSYFENCVVMTMIREKYLIT